MTTTKFNKIERDFKNNLQKETIINSIFTILIFATMIIIISSPKTYTDGTISGIKLFFYSVLPGLFPFMLLTKLLTELGFIYKKIGRAHV